MANNLDAAIQEVVSGRAKKHEDLYIHPADQLRMRNSGLSSPLSRTHTRRPPVRIVAGSPYAPRITVSERHLSIPRTPLSPPQDESGQKTLCAYLAECFFCMQDCSWCLPGSRLNLQFTPSLNGRTRVDSYSTWSDVYGQEPDHEASLNSQSIDKSDGDPGENRGRTCSEILCCQPAGGRRVDRRTPLLGGNRLDFSAEKARVRTLSNHNEINPSSKPIRVLEAGALGLLSEYQSGSASSTVPLAPEIL